MRNAISILASRRPDPAPPLLWPSLRPSAPRAATRTAAPTSTAASRSSPPAAAPATSSPTRAPAAARRGRTSTPPSRAARHAGMDSDTIAGVVKAQVENPRPLEPKPLELDAGRARLGPGPQRHRRLRRRVAGTGIKPPKIPGGTGGAGLRLEWLRRLPHARRGRGRRHDRARTSTRRSRGMSAA